MGCRYLASVEQGHNLFFITWARVLDSYFFT